MSRSNVSDLVGKVLTRVNTEADLVEFETADGEKYRLYHEQDCCESVALEDVIGNVDDLIGVPMVMAEEVSGDIPERKDGEYTPDSETWTFYKFGTIKGYVTFRFYGTSNGYYSEAVYFDKF